MNTYAEPKPKDRGTKQAGRFFSNGSAAAIPQLASSGASASVSRLQSKMNSSPRATQLKRFQQLANRGPHAQGSAQLQVRMNRRNNSMSTGPIQRECGQAMDGKLLQGKFGAAQRQQDPAPQPNRTGLPDGLKSGIESLSGMDMSGVRVHTNSSKPAQLNALAYAQGNHIHVAPGQEKHLPHEAWHVVQQAQGRVKPTMQLKDKIPINDDPALEREATVMGAKALGSADRMATKAATPALQREIVQGLQFQRGWPPGASRPLSPHTNVIQPAGWATWGAAALGLLGAVGAAGLGLPIATAAGIAALGAVGGAALGLGYEYRTGNKIDKDVFIGQGESIDDIKTDVDRAMVKIQAAFKGEGVFARELQSVQGRDQPVYAFRKWLLGSGLGPLIREWNPQWTIEDTAGLLLDVGSKIKTTGAFKAQPKTDKDLLAPVHNAVRKQDKTFRLKGSTPEADWARGIERNFRVNAGPSATTATLLNFLSVFPNITNEEREAIMQAVILFWRGYSKRGMGDYHTGAEVWMAYSRRLDIEKEERKKQD